MKFEAVTIKDIAKALGLSTSTVSRALRDSYEISEDTKKLVKEYATSINYRPNPIALSLKEKRSRSIGVIVCEIANSFFSQIINGIESIAYDQGYNVTISQSHESFEREVLDVSHMASRSIDGLLISVSAETQNFDHLKKLHAQGLPIVFFDRIVHEIATHKVTTNNASGAYAATTHLIENGYRRIANLAAADYMTITQERLSGYRSALADKGIAYDERLVKHCTHGGMLEQEVQTALDDLFAQPQKPDAIVASADKLTTNCLRYLHKNGITVPDDIALVGFSNSDLTELLSPPLTIVKQPAFEIGRQATEMLLQLIEAKRPVKDFEHTVLPAELFIRESSIRKK
ncbi:transcriptional regulator, LacI family [Filimonas lacunae]|uniref:Transcriptional regulator, LacI family n=1 Tax=Filimonas lacunae TaxID=477680 RepID=A0A173MAJ9_9BACT|nr:LacI family DNA-binding transcriptional regulator [Filimonas lacunae]BAV04521.1 LacI family transcriptional regulator [Filimonas lacunae]SIT31676.1 transcriptional regulator, LacI family [Filimonas lacunae]